MLIRTASLGDLDALVALENHCFDHDRITRRQFRHLLKKGHAALYVAVADDTLYGSLVLLFTVSLLFIAANLAMGITFSTVARNQLQAMQMSFFFFLPSILLSGFMFPFRGMPVWAQYIGQVLPLTHYLRVVRGILLKGSGIAQIWIHLWPIALFVAAVLFIALKRYRQTLD